MIPRSASFPFIPQKSSAEIGNSYDAVVQENTELKVTVAELNTDVAELEGVLAVQEETFDLMQRNAVLRTERIAKLEKRLEKAKNKMVVPAESTNGFHREGRAATKNTATLVKRSHSLPLTKDESDLEIHQSIKFKAQVNASGCLLDLQNPKVIEQIQDIYSTYCRTENKIEQLQKNMNANLMNANGISSLSSDESSHRRITTVQISSFSRTVVSKEDLQNSNLSFSEFVRNTGSIEISWLQTLEKSVQFQEELVNFLTEQQLNKYTAPRENMWVFGEKLLHRAILFAFGTIILLPILIEDKRYRGDVLLFIKHAFACRMADLLAKYMIQSFEIPSRSGVIDINRVENLKESVQSQEKLVDFLVKQLNKRTALERTTLRANTRFIAENWLDRTFSLILALLCLSPILVKDRKYRDDVIFFSMLALTLRAVYIPANNMIQHLEKKLKIGNVERSA